MEFLIEPVERSTDIVDFAMPLRMSTVAEASTAKVEAQHRESETVEGLHGVEDDLVMQRAAVDRVWMADQRRVSRGG
jgi:hypothetical protein